MLRQAGLRSEKHLVTYLAARLIAPIALGLIVLGVLEIATATAGFRDQFYGLIPFVRDGPADAPLVTSGLLDPGRSAWGERPARFGGLSQRIARQGEVVEPDRTVACPCQHGVAGRRLA